VLLDPSPDVGDGLRDMAIFPARLSPVTIRR